MTNNILGDIADNINEELYSVRAKYRRSREFEFGPHSVKTDGMGNILARPKTTGLACFGNPVEYMFGLFDRARVFKGNESPKDCGGCKVQQACYKVADERIESDTELSQLRTTFGQQTGRIPGGDKFRHPSFGELRAAIEKRTWTDSNDKLVADEKRRIDRERKTKPFRRRKPTPDEVKALEEERVKREEQLLAACRDRRSDHRFRFLDDDRCKFIAHVWHAKKYLGLTGGKVSQSEIARHLSSIGATYGIKPASMNARVGDAVARCEWLEGGGVWTDAKGTHQGMSASAVTVILDDD